MRDSLRTKRLQWAAKSMRRSLPAGFCTAPFTQMFIYPTGDVFVCCEGAGHLGNLKERTLEDLWNGPEARKLRREFLSGKPLQCAKKIDAKRCHEGYDDLLPDTIFSEVQPGPPQALDLITDGSCNLDCVMCDVKNQRTNLMATAAFESEIAQKVFPTVKKISVKSGEPFVQKATYEMIDRVSEENPECVWQFTTNGQYSFNAKIRAALEKIRLGRMSFSIDAIEPELFSEIRRGGTLARALETLGAAREWAKEKDQPFTVDFVVNVTLQKKNWREVPKILRHFREMDIPTSLLFVEDPKDCSLLSMTEEEANVIFDHYCKLSSEFDPVLPELTQAFSPLLSVFENPLIRKLSAMLQLRILDYKKRRSGLCPFPFSQLAVIPNGKLQPCCWLKDYELRENQGGDLKTAWNGAPIRALREEHLAGKPKICADYMKNLGCHRAHRDLLAFIDLKLEQSLPQLRLDWFFSGKCNLQCESCHNWKFSEELPGADETFEKLKADVLPYLLEIDLKGGEPFYQARTFELMNVMRELNPHCVWDITTNGQLRFGDVIREKLDGLLIGDMAVSIDSLDPVLFSRLRKGGTLEKTLQFLDELIAYNSARPMGRRFHVLVNFVFQRANWRETAAFLEFARGKGVTPVLIPLVDPPGLSVYTLEASEFDQVCAYVNELCLSDESGSLKELADGLNRRRGGL